MKAQNWIIAGLSVVVLVLAVTLFRVWPPEYAYLHQQGILIRVHRGDGKTEAMVPAKGWIEQRSK